MEIEAGQNHKVTDYRVYHSGGKRPRIKMAEKQRELSQD